MVLRQDRYRGQKTECRTFPLWLFPWTFPPSTDIPSGVQYLQHMPMRQCDFRKLKLKRKRKKSKTKTIITLTTVPWMRHCGDWPTARLKHARLWSGSSSRSSNCPVLIRSQHLLVLVQRLSFSTMLLKCALIQFWIAVLSSSGKLARLNSHFCPRSPLIWFQPQRRRRML